MIIPKIILLNNQFISPVPISWVKSVLNTFCYVSHSWSIVLPGMSGYLSRAVPWGKKGAERGDEGGGNSGRLVHRGRGPCHLAMRRTMSGELSSNDTTARWMEHRSDGWWAVDSVYAHSNIPYTTSVMFTFDGSLIWSAQVNVRKGFTVPVLFFLQF